MPTTPARQTQARQTPAAPRSFADVVLQGRLGSRVEERELPSGDRITTFTVVVDRPLHSGARRGAEGSGRTSTVRVDAIVCQTFRADVIRRLERLEPGQEVRAEGCLRRRFWRTGAGLGSAMEVEVSRLTVVRQR
jgi:single-strand DNA-binding protein